MRLKEEWKDAFSMGKKIVIEDFYVKPNPARKELTYTKEKVEEFEKLIRQKKGLYYKDSDMWLYQAFDEFDIKGKSVVVEQPWYETMAWVYSGQPCSCLEYNKRICEFEDFTYYQYDKFDEMPKFDVCISVSSIEHSGLGRYGDEIDPMGDVKAMDDMKRLLNDDGILFLSIPVGVDRVMWNAHRVYGNTRLPVLLKGWECIKTYGVSEELLKTTKNSYNTVQPVFVLKEER
jgi:SAM-dependent methyltransferase